MSGGFLDRIELRLALSGQAQTIAGLNAVTAAQLRMQAANNRMGAGMAATTQRTWLMNQALFTARRLTYAGTLAVGAMAAGVVGFGLKFNASMQQNQVAFTHFLGSAQLATAYLDKLYDLAAVTPFEFQDLTEATKKLIAFGYSADGAYRTMVDIGDAAAGLGVSKEGIDRMTLAFGQMQTNGRILGGELRQLAEVGINARKYLQEAFHLTPDQMANIGRLHIPAKLGIEAILQGMERDFHGMAKDQATTFTGLMSTIHDYTQKLFGTITHPLFVWLSEKALPKIVTLTKAMSEGFERGGWTGMMRAMDQSLGLGGKLNIVWGRLASIGHSLGIILGQEIWPALVLIARSLVPFLALLWPISYALKLMADHTTIFGTALKILAVYIIVNKILLVGLGTIYLRLGRLIGILIDGYAVLILRMKSFITWTGAAQASNGRFVKIGPMQRFFMMLRTQLTASVVALKRYAIAVMVAARAMMVFLLTNPIGWAIIIITTLTVLYFKWKWFHDKVNAIFFWIRDHWPLLAIILLGPFGVFIVAISKSVNQIWNLIKWVWDKAKEFYNWVQNTPILGWLIPGGPIGQSQQNSAAQTMTFNGNAAGKVPKSSAGTPGGIFNTKPVNPTFNAANINGGSERVIEIHHQTIIDGKAVAESVSRYGIKKEALR